MSKLLISCVTLSSGGAERVISVLSKPFADNYNEVVIVMWLKKPVFYKIDERVRLVYLPDISGTSNRYAEIFSFRKVVNSENPDIILSFLTPFNVLVEIATIGMSVPVVVCERTDPDRSKGLAKILRNLAYLRADGILTQTFISKHSFRGNLNKKTDVIYNPITMSDEEVGSALHAEKEKLMVSAGRLISIKNQKMMIDACKVVSTRHPEYKLVIYGEGPYKDTLQEYIKAEGMVDCVLLPGNKKNIWDCIKPAQVFLLTSNFEGMPNAMLEAMCLGLPCVSTKLKAAEELISDGINGYIVDFNDSVALADRICFLIENPDKALAIGERATEIYKQVKEDRVSAQWIEYINNKINRQLQ